MWQLDYKEDWEWKNWCFWIEVLQKTLESSFDGKEIKPLSPKGNPEYSLEGLMLKLKVKYFGHLMRRADLMEKSLTPGKIEGKRRMGWQRMRWWDSITNSMNVNVSKLWETVKHWKPGMPQSMRSQRVRHDCEAERQQYTCYSISLSLYHFNVSFLAMESTILSILIEHRFSIQKSHVNFSLLRQPM